MIKFSSQLVLALFVAFAAANDSDVHAEIKSLKSDVRPDGFDIALETSNGIHEQASGDVHGNIHGSYEYVSPEGEHVQVSYTADETGYHPASELLPTPPPIPEAILKAIEYIKAHPPKEDH
ncbi:larval cuticle protein 4-like [Musca vetustissima]|uniref:larval cuticle protein 4-like n=1 Tax=Musca vetustissima TaxID=27455 RepID=UPI002AB78612|nr:larval cuticle protein 4-like [Musca vetustissima]